MKPQILVAINNQDRLSQLMPHIENIAQPGMKVVFLIRCSTQPAVTASAPRSVELNPNEARIAGRVEEANSTPEWQSHFMAAQRLITEHKVFLALEALLGREIEITVDVYTGSFRKAVKRYMRAGNVYLIMRRAGWGFATKQFFYSLTARFVSLKQPALFVVHPVHAN